MKKVGLIGGIGCASTALYYKIITQHITERLGTGHTGYIVIYSIDESDIYSAVAKKQWEKAGQILIQAAHSLEKSGVDFILICSNLFHKFANEVKQHCRIPIIHILEPVCEIINKNKYTHIGLIGTRIAMTENYYSDYLLKNSCTKKVTIPKEEQIEEVNRIIFEELLSNIVTESSKKALIHIVQSLQKMGVEALILGCTELALILSQKDLTLPVLDTTKLHATFAAERMICTVQ